MVDAPRALILDLLEWLAAGPRAYVEVMDAWRTSCPRLTIWEDAVDRGLVRRRRDPGEDAVVELTEAGRAWLETGRPGRAAPTPEGSGRKAG